MLAHDNSISVVLKIMTSALRISVKVLFQLLVNIVIAAFFLELVNVLAYWLVEKGHAYAQETGLLLVPPPILFAKS